MITPQTPLAHAWGNPAAVLTCGVGLPRGYSPTSSETTAVNGVQWFQQRLRTTVVWTALRPGPVKGQTINVQLQVPTHYEEQGSFLVDLAQPLKTALP